LRERGVSADAKVYQTPRDLDLPATELQLRARLLAGAQLRSRMLVWVDVSGDGEFLRTVPVPLELAGVGLDRGGSPALAPVAADPPGQPQSRASVILVERGGWATLRSSDGAVSLESKVAVLQDGRAGDHVRVRAPGGGGIVFARVTGPAQLELAP
jgi:flagella basal body P-ring formation protein FlgA